MINFFRKRATNISLKCPSRTNKKTDKHHKMAPVNKNSRLMSETVQFPNVPGIKS